MHSFLVIVFIVVAAIAVRTLFFASEEKKKSVILQAINYLARAHTTPKKYERIANANMAWNGTYLSQHPEIWSYELTEEDVNTIETAVFQFQKLNKSTEDMIKGTDFDFSPTMRNNIKEWRYQLESSDGNGRGFQLIRGVPVHRWTMKQCEIFFWAFGKFLGIPGAQDKAGALVHHVIDAGTNNTVPRPYRMKVDIDFHVDGSDVVGLMCLHPAKQGGSSRIISTVSVYNALVDQFAAEEQAEGMPGLQQALIRRLFGTVMLYTRKTFGLAKFLPVHPLRIDSKGVLRTYWNQGFFTQYYRSSASLSSAGGGGGGEAPGELTAAGQADPLLVRAIEAYDDVLRNDFANTKQKTHDNDDDANKDNDTSNGAATVELGLQMDLQPGDIQLASNHFILHARTAFTDYTDEEIYELRTATSENIGNKDRDGDFTGVEEFSNEQKLIGVHGRRDLLRLWLSHSHEEMEWKLYASKQIDLLRVLFGLVQGILFHRE